MASYIVTLKDQSREYVDGNGVDYVESWFVFKGDEGQDAEACYSAEWVLSIRKVRPGEKCKSV